MITDKKLEEAMVEAERFLEAAKVLRECRKSMKDGVFQHHAFTAHWSTTVEHASCKRASLDLTRKLAELRAGK